MFMRHRIRAAAVALALLVAVPACSTTPESASGGAPKGGKVDKILFDFPFTALPIYAAVTRSVQQAADAAGVKVVFTNDNMDLGAQVTNLTTYLHSDVDAVVSFPADPASIDSLAKQYMDAGKIWITYGGDLPHQSASLQFSFLESGRMLGRGAGEWASRTLGGQGKAVILSESTTQIGKERTQGLLEGLRAAAPNLEIVAQQQAITPQQGLTVTSAVLAQHPDVNIVLAVPGDAAQGGYQALLSAGRSPKDGRTYVGALDGNLYLFQEMQKGNAVRAIVTAKTSEVGRAAIEIPLAIGRGQTPQTDLPVYLVTADSRDLSDYIKDFNG